MGWLGSWRLWGRVFLGSAYCDRTQFLAVVGLRSPLPPWLLAGVTLGSEGPPTFLATQLPPSLSQQVHFTYSLCPGPLTPTLGLPSCD